MSQSKVTIATALRLEIWYSDIVTMTFKHHFTEKLRWRVFERLKVEQSQTKVDDNAKIHRARIVDVYLEQESIQRMQWSVRSTYFTRFEHVWDAIERPVAALNSPFRALPPLSTDFNE
ncbi:hypothetical protein TNCV_3968181 [Trichonephila clavipes]|nr:hypothetical protein TNCV_3968181 [Trichonephila clavipes]